MLRIVNQKSLRGAGLIDSAAVTTGRPASYTYAELAERIEQVLGERPSRSALRAELARRPAERSQHRPRATAGIPPPLPATSRTAPSAFAVEAVEQWLEYHPRRAWNTAISELTHALTTGQDLTHAISSARAAGLSWRQITTAMNAVDGRTRSTAGVHKAFRHIG